MHPYLYECIFQAINSLIIFCIYMWSTIKNAFEINLFDYKLYMNMCIYVELELL